MANKIFAKLGSAHGVTYVVNEAEVLKTDVNSDSNPSKRPSPVDGVSMALSGCMLSGIRGAADKYNLDVENTRIEIEAIMKDTPRRIGEFKIDIFFNKPFTEKEQAAIERSIKGCPVANSLSSEIIKTISYHYAQ